MRFTPMWFQGGAGPFHTEDTSFSISKYVFYKKPIAAFLPDTSPQSRTVLGSDTEPPTYSPPQEGFWNWSLKKQMNYRV